MPNINAKKSLGASLTARAAFVVALGAVALSARAQETQPAQTGTTFRAGFARADITPPVGAEIPGGFRKNLSEGVHDPLWAEAAVMSNGTLEVALVGVDLVMIPDDVVQAARKQVAARCGVPAGHVLIAASHTHNGGPIVDCFGSERDPTYCALVAERVADAVCAAHEAATDARVAIGTGHEASVAFNRRFRMKDGSVKTHPGKMNPDIVAPAGPIDPEVAVIAVQNAEGQLMGCIVNYALHGTTFGGRLVSADWPHYLRETIRGVMGPDLGVVFLNGACGDVTQVDNQSLRRSEFGEAWARRVGMTVGAEALKVLAKAEFTDETPLAVAVESLALPIRDLGESDEALLAREAPASGLGAGGDDVYRREARLVREMKAASPTVAVEVQAIRIGEAAIVTNPTEFFCALGLAIKQQSPWGPTLVAELTNGYAGYAPTSEAFRQGGYETRTARSSFLAPDAGEVIVEASLRLLATLNTR